MLHSLFLDVAGGEPHRARDHLLPHSLGEARLHGGSPLPTDGRKHWPLGSLGHASSQGTECMVILVSQFGTYGMTSELSLLQVDPFLLWYGNGCHDTVIVVMEIRSHMHLTKCSCFRNASPVPPVL